MKNLKLSFVLAFFSFAIFTFTACEKEATLDANSDDLSDIELTENAFELIEIEEATNFSMEMKAEEKTGFACMTVTIHPNQNGTFWPHGATLDFGSVNCTAPNGHTYRGKIHVTQTAYWNLQGATRTTTFEDFYIDDYKIEGTKVLTNNGLNNDLHISFTQTITGGKITTPDGTAFITCNSTRTRELLEGALTHTYLDNVYQITGNENGSTWNGNTYTKTITVPLRKSAACKFPESGKVEFVINDQEPIVLDYGDGTCDAKATLSRGDEVLEIILGEKFKAKKE